MLLTNIPPLAIDMKAADKRPFIFGGVDSAIYIGVIVIAVPVRKILHKAKAGVLNLNLDYPCHPQSKIYQ